MDKPVIYVDEKGYQEMVDRLKRLNAAFSSVNMENAKALSGDAKDLWRTSLAFDDANNLSAEIKELYDQLERVQIVDHELVENLVNLNDIVTVNYADSNEPLQFKLVGTSAKPTYDVPEITINSPLGNAVYRQPVGAERSFEANGKLFKITIIDKQADNIKEENFTK